jgi:prepilin-type N-terminal cleavage/methylation domain-containing protein
MNLRTRGFTLIELLIAISAIGILLPVMYSIMYEPLQRHTIESAREAREADFDKVHRMLGRDNRSAARVGPAMETIASGTSDHILETLRERIQDRPIAFIIVLPPR